MPRSRQRGGLIVTIGGQTMREKRSWKALWAHRCNQKSNQSNQECNQIALSRQNKTLKFQWVEAWVIRVWFPEQQMNSKKFPQNSRPWKRWNFKENSDFGKNLHSSFLKMKNPWNVEISRVWVVDDQGLEPWTPCSPKLFLQGVTGCCQMLYLDAVMQWLQGVQSFHNKL